MPERLWIVTLGGAAIVAKFWWLILGSGSLLSCDVVCCRVWWRRYDLFLCCEKKGVFSFFLDPRSSDSMRPTPSVLVLVLVL